MTLVLLSQGCGDRQFKEMDGSAPGNRANGSNRSSDDSTDASNEPTGEPPSDLPGDSPTGPSSSPAGSGGSNQSSEYFDNLKKLIAKLAGKKTPADPSAPEKTYPTCKSAASDPDKDGWGWENGAFCKVVAGSATPNATAASPGSGTSSYPECKSAGSDPDGDGWGWENSTSCKVVNPAGGIDQYKNVCTELAAKYPGKVRVASDLCLCGNGEFKFEYYQIELIPIEDYKSGCISAVKYAFPGL